MELEIITRTPEGAAHEIPVLFVHGAWHGAWCWEKYFMPYFAEKGFVCHAFSLRGHGNSETPESFSRIRVSDYVEDLGRVIRRLPADPVLVGHSMGGFIVQKYLEEHDARAAVLLASVPVKGVFKSTLRMARRNFRGFVKSHLTWSLYPVVETPELVRKAFFSEDISPDLLNDYFGRIQNESPLAFLDLMVLNLPKPEKVSADLLILGAENDEIFHPFEIRELAAAYNKHPEFFSDMAHDMMLEHGWQAVADRIIGWIKKKGGSETTAGPSVKRIRTERGK